MIRRCFSPDRRRGFTLTELAIVLGVIGLILSAIWYAASSVQEARKENDAVLEAQTIAHNINELYAGQNLPMPLDGSTGHLTSLMITAQVVPSSYIDLTNQTAIDNPWDLGVPDPNSTNNANRGVEIYRIASKTYRLAFYHVPFSGCVALISAMTNCQSGQSDCTVQAYTNYSQNQLDTGDNPGVAKPANISWTNYATSSNIDALCTANINPTAGNSVEFDFHL